MEDNTRISWKTLDGIDGLSQKTPNGLSWKTLDGIDGLS